MHLLMRHFSISHWETGTSRLQRIIIRWHRREQRLLTEWFMYTDTEPSALKYHHTEGKKKYQSIITLFELDKGQRASVGGILSESVARFLRAICDARVRDGIYKPCFFLPSTACCQRSLYRSLPSHNACTEPNPTHLIFILLKFNFLQI